MADISPEQQAHREAFGRALTTWMKQQGWSQQVPHDWGLAQAGELGTSSGPHNSQISLAQRGKHDPKPQFFVSLGAFNTAVATQDLANVTTRALVDRLKGAEPFYMNDGQPARASDFFAMFVGDAPIPERYATTDKPPTNQEAAEINEQLRSNFREGAKARMLTPAEAWPVLWKSLSLPTKLRPKLKDVLSGWDEFKAEELADGLVAASLQGWARKG